MAAAFLSRLKPWASCGCFCDKTMMQMDNTEIKNFLKVLGFSSKDEEIFTKKYKKHNNYEIKADLAKGKIFYRPDRKTTESSNPKPDGFIQLGDLTTSNFSHPENLVVLDAVNRLLEIGYKPENIHLERKWKLGRTGKSGKADITVYFPTENSTLLKNKYSERQTFMIIECKTWGEEYEKEKRRLFKTGGQLFSYFQQDRSTNLLVLYTSIFEENEITYDSLLIKVKDDEELVKKYRERIKDEQISCAYVEAVDVSSLVDVWKRVYNQYVFKHGVFEEDVGLYSIELKPLKKKDLIPLKSSQGLFNAFAEILRHNNISDNANAFNKMLSLFLCKIVDEETKKDDDVLDFQVKEKESFEELVDRLQRLYKTGMERYLGIDDFVYFSDENIREIIKLYPQRSTLEEIEEIFKQIKYYTNNEFAFKEVHNKKLFYQNALILSEVIELLQNYRIKYSHKNQILGDFFELLLNHGVKQSEGQFFTPLPIVRFMIISVSFDDYIQKCLLKKPDEEPLPKILDYACGAAHFLTEAIDEINKFIPKIEIEDLKIKSPWEERYIFGVEKDYRLARTAKIACFLNGDGSANIIFGDGLDDYEKFELNKRKFDFILTNPPYAVKKFKNYLEAKPKYELLKYLTENSREIEVLFIERAKQVLADGGRIAIILPSSILSNSGVYTKARELILKHFELKAIAEFGSQTFIATGTNTVVLFMERRPDWFWKDREKIAREIFDKKEIKQNDYVDIKKLFNMFIEYRELPAEDYKKFIFENEITDTLADTEVFKSYNEWFNNLAEIKNLKKKKSFKQKTKEEQDAEIKRLYLEKIKEKEKEKFFYFTLMFRYGDEYGQSKWYEFQQVIVARAPSKTDEQKQYLGYEFNKRRGFEGIEIYKDAQGKPTTKLYDDEDYYNPKKVAFYIRRNFENKKIAEIDDEIKSYLNIYNLPDLFDFERVEFEKKINLAAKKKIVIQTKWELKKLGDICPETTQGLTFPKEVQSPSLTRKRVLTSTHITLDHRLSFLNPIYLNEDYEVDDKYKLKKGDIFVATSSGSLKHLGKFTFTKRDLDYFAGGFCAILRGADFITQKYISLALTLDFYRDFISNFSGQNINNLNIEDLKNLKIPVPPINIQQKIIEKFEALEKKEEQNIKLIEEKQKEIEEIVEEIFRKNYNYKELGHLCKIFNGGTPNTKIKEYWDGNIPWITLEDVKGKYIYDTKRKITELGLKKSNAKLLPINTVVFSSRATIGAVAITKIELTTNQGFKNFVCNPNLLDYNFLYYILKKEAKNIEKISTGTKYKEISKNAISKYKIPLPPLKIQQDIVNRINAVEEEIEQLKQKNKKITKAKKEVLKKYL